MGITSSAANPMGFNSHWEVESHWTAVLNPSSSLTPEVSIPIGKLSLIGLVIASCLHYSAMIVSIPIGKLSLIGPLLASIVERPKEGFQFPLGS